MNADPAVVMDADPAAERPSLTLFINGASTASGHTVQQLHDLCEQTYPAGYDLEVVDVHQQPALVASRAVVAVPTLIKDLPRPMRLVVGDFTDKERVLHVLGVTTPAKEKTRP